VSKKKQVMTLIELADLIVKLCAAAELFFTSRKSQAVGGGRFNI